MNSAMRRMKAIASYQQEKQQKQQPQSQPQQQNKSARPNTNRDNMWNMFIYIYVVSKLT